MKLFIKKDYEGLNGKEEKKKEKGLEYYYRKQVEVNYLVYQKV